MGSASSGSRASADLPPGTVVAGFRVERTIGRGSRAAVYEATQLALDRRVALKVLDDRGQAERVRRLTWPEHPAVVGLFGAGVSEHGPWLAMQLLPGGTLATTWAPLDGVADALRHAHTAGVVHGDVNARNVLVHGGRAYLSDFGLGSATATATAADDDAMLARLRREHPEPPPPRWGGRRRTLLLGGAVAVTAAVAAVLLAFGGGGETVGPDAALAPPVVPGAIAVGNVLAPGPAATVDCRGAVPDGASPACTLSPRTLAGRRVVVPVDGTIVGWAVRGARGPLALQVLRARGRAWVAVDRTGDEQVHGLGPQRFRTDLAVAAGDRVAVELAPGAAVGVRRRQGATTERWYGPLRDQPLAPDAGAGTGLDREVLVRVDVVRAEGPVTIAPLRGAAAARAAPGFLLAMREVAVRGGGGTRTAKVVVLGAAVAVDLFDGDRRVARAAVAGGDGRGRLRAFEAKDGAVRVRWRNPGGADFERAYAVTTSGLDRPSRPASPGRR